MDDLTEKELAKKYSGTFCQIKTPQGILPVLVKAIGNGSALVRYGSTENVFNLREIEFLPRPYSKVFNFGNRVALFVHLPERQWKLGMCPDNSRFIDCVTKAVTGGRGVITVEEESVTAMFTTYYHRSLYEAIADMSNRVATCITEDFWLMLTKDKNIYMLWYLGVPAAKLDASTNRITMVTHVFRQEVVDLINRTGEQFYVS